MGAHPLPPTPTPLTFDHAWRLEPSDRRRTGCDLMCAHKRVHLRHKPSGSHSPAHRNDVSRMYRTGQRHLDGATQNQRGRGVTILTHASQRTNTKLRDMAEELVRTGALPVDTLRVGRRHIYNSVEV